MVDAHRGEGEVRNGAPRRLFRMRAAVGLLGCAALGYGLVRAVPLKSEMLDLLGDPAPDLSAVAGALTSASAEAGVDRSLLLALAAVESAGKANVKSHAGAIGLLQLMPATAMDLAKELRIEPEGLDLEDPALNARLGARYLAQLLSAFAGDEGLALAAYNAGPRKVRDWLARAADADSRTVIDREGFAETRRHVERVLRFKAIYAAR